MKNNLTELVFILDRSGSMGGLESDTIGGFNSMIEKNKKTENDVLVTTILFDHEIMTLHDRISIKEIPQMTDKDYQVRGSTALIDAIGHTVEHIQKIHKYARPEDVPAKTIFVITTDGQENSSRKYSSDDVKKMISRLQEEKKWEFLFIGANIDAVETASHFGIKAKRASNYKSDKEGTGLLYDTLGDVVMCCMAMPEEMAEEDRDLEIESKLKRLDDDLKKRS